VGFFLGLSFQQRAAVKSGRLDQQNQQHDGKRRHLRERRVDEGTQRDDLPLMPSLRSLLESEEYNHRTILSVVPDDLDLEDLVRRTEAVVGNFDDADTGFLFVVPVLTARGLGRRGSGGSATGSLEP